MLSGAYLLSMSLPGKTYLEKIAAWGAKLSPYLIALSLTVLGIENFLHNKLVFIVGASPYELPGEGFWTYCTSIIFIAVAFTIVFSKNVGVTATLLGVYIFFIAVIFYVPLLWINIYDAHGWATFLKGIAMSGSAFILSRATSKVRATVLKESIPI